MRHARWLSPLMTGVSVLALTGVVAPAEAQAFRFHYDHVLGTSLDIVAVAGNRDMALVASEAACAEIQRLNKILSTRDADSEISRLNTVASATTSPELFAVLAACELWREKTDRAFSVRQGRVLAAWNNAARTGIAPDAEELALLADEAEAAEVLLDPATRRVTRPDSVVFAPDALAKGAVIDAAVAAARKAAPSLVGLMIDIGGDVRLWGRGPHGRAPHGKEWHVGVADPAQQADNAALAAVLRVSDKAVATSARGPRDLTVAGARHFHIVDPSTGRPVEHTASATVVAATAVDADALATAFSAMPAEKAIAVADRLPGVETLVVARDGRRHTSRGWHGLTLASDQMPAMIQKAAAGAPWPAGFTVNLDYEIPKMEAGIYRAPYVAIWVTDEQRNMVRMLTLLGDNEKWIDSNYVWWRRWGRKAPEMISTVSKATRMPGRYSLAWDGKDDAGKPVGQGKYLIHIEATREHGGHTYQMIEVDLGQKAADTAQPAKDELGAVKLRYGTGK